MDQFELIGKKILLVDDEPDIRESLKDFFEMANAQVSEAENGRVAFDLIGKDKFDLVISDIQMAGDDIEACIKEKKIKVGSGGLYVSGAFSDLNVNDLIQLQFKNDMTLSCKVKWLNNDPTKNYKSGMGVEFYNLSSSARKFFKNKIKNESPHSFIPKE